MATLWKQKFPDAKVALKARNVDSEREGKWKSLGFVAYQDGDKYNNVLFAVPPSGQFRKKERVMLRKNVRFPYFLYEHRSYSPLKMHFNFS